MEWRRFAENKPRSSITVSPAWASSPTGSSSLGCPQFSGGLQSALTYNVACMTDDDAPALSPEDLAAARAAGASAPTLPIALAEIEQILGPSLRAAIREASEEPKQR